MCTDPYIASVLKAKTRHPDFGQLRPFDTVEIRAQANGEEVNRDSM